MKVKHKDKITPVVGITGLPASGKSSALKVFARAGFGTFSADESARAVFRRAGTAAAVKRIFGTVSRKKVAASAFRDSRKLRSLEKIIHPAVIRELRAAVSLARRRRRPFAAEVPLLFEKKLEKLFNTIVMVVSPRRLIMERLASKEISRRTAAGMIRAHLPQTRKSSRADIVVRNAGSLKDFQFSVACVIETIKGG
jgi:dephospho-CoA kinase